MFNVNVIVIVVVIVIVIVIVIVSSVVVVVVVDVLLFCEDAHTNVCTRCRAVGSMYTASRRRMRAVGKHMERSVGVQTRALILEYGVHSTKNCGSSSTSGVTSRNAVTVTSTGRLEGRSTTCMNAPRSMPPAWHMMPLATLTFVDGASISSNALQSTGPTK